MFTNQVFDRICGKLCFWDNCWGGKPISTENPYLVFLKQFNIYFSSFASICTSAFTGQCSNQVKSTWMISLNIATSFSTPAKLLVTISNFITCILHFIRRPMRIFIRPVNILPIYCSIITKCSFICPQELSQNIALSQKKWPGGWTFF